MKVQLKIAILYMVLQSSWHVASALVNDECAQDGTCDGKNEVCDTGSTPKVCQCSTTSMNDGTGKCVSSACSPGPNACSNIQNTTCKTATCVCNVLSTPETEAGPTKDACVLKECTAAANCDASDDSVGCSDTTSGVCKCAEKLTMPSETSCITRELGWPCSGDNAECAGVGDAVCTNKVCACDPNFTPEGQNCKIAVGDDCTGNEEKCVSNAVCGEDDNQCACNEGYTPDGSFCVGPDDRSGGSTQRPFVGGALMFVVVIALRLLN